MSRIGTTNGTLLGGRLRYMQPAEGYRTGIEPVMLAACVPARPGERVLEAGTGAGAGLLCLLAREPQVVATGLERDAELADLARANLHANGMKAAVQTGDVTVAALDPTHHAFANPPWHSPAATPPAHSMRGWAKQRDLAGLTGWVPPLAAALLPGGTLSLVLPAALLAEALALLHGAGLGGAAVMPLWPRVGVAAKLILLRASRSRSPSRMLPGLVLHGPDGFTPEAEAVLRDGAALRF